MKQFILSFCMVFSVVTAIQSQTITLSQEEVTASFTNVLLDGNADLIAPHIAVTNNTSDTVRLKWLREIPVSCPEGWKTQLCDNDYCFSASSSTNYNPPAVNESFELLPGETFPNYLMHVKPDVTPGCCQVLVHFSTIESPDEVLATVTFNVSVNTPDCSVLSTFEPSVLESLQAFPNPSNGFFSITENTVVETIVVHNLLGKQVCNAKYQNGKSYDLTDAPDGLYIVSMLDENGEFLKAVRVTKQALRP